MTEVQGEADTDRTDQMRRNRKRWNRNKQEVRAGGDTACVCVEVNCEPDDRQDSRPLSEPPVKQTTSRLQTEEQQQSDRSSSLSAHAVRFSLLLQTDRARVRGCCRPSLPVQLKLFTPRRHRGCAEEESKL